MHPILLEDTPPSGWETGLNHSSILFGLILTILGILVAYYKLRAQHKETLKAREQSVIERNDQRVLLEKISTQFSNNGGSSLLDKVEQGNKILSDHVIDAKEQFVKNDEQHKEIHRRIDGMFTLLAGNSANTPRKTAERHMHREEQSNE